MSSKMVYRRRVQVTGGSTLIVSLPKEWAKAAGVESGSEVFIEVMPDYTLKITPLKTHVGSTPVEREISIDCSCEATAVVIEVLSSYLAGYERIRVRVENGCLELAREVVERLRGKAIGLEVLEETGDSIVFYSIMNSSTLKIADAIARMISTTRCMLEDVGLCLEKYNPEVLNGVVERDDVVDKLFLLILRQLNQVLLGQLSPSAAGLVCLPESLYVLAGVKSIERIADHAVAIAGRMIESGEVECRGLKKYTNTYHIVMDAFRSASKAFIEPGRASVRRAVSKLLEARRRVVEAESIKPESSVIELLLESMRRIVAYSMDMVEASASISTLREILKDRIEASRRKSVES